MEVQKTTVSEKENDRKEFKRKLASLATNFDKVTTLTAQFNKSGGETLKLDDQ